MTRKPTVLLADDHAMVVAGLSRLLEPEFEVAGTAHDGLAMVASANALNPDVIVADITMPLLNGLEAVRQLRKSGARSKVIFLTMHSDASIAAEALDAGASGYLLKESAAEELITAIRQVLRGHIYITPLIAGGVLESFRKGAARTGRPAGKLTARERQVLQLVAEGRSAKEIGGILKVSARTAEFHKYNAMAKLNLRTTAELTQYALKHGLVAS